MGGKKDIVEQALRLVAGAEPQKTAKAYKLFKQREGKLYPLFVDANEEVPLNQWLKAKAGEQAASGQVKSKAGPLAYRPGWHAGDLPIATHIGAKAHGNKRLPPDTRRSDEVWAEVEMADDVDWQKIADERARITKKGTPDPKTAHITDQVPYGGYYRYKTSPTMQGNWMIGGDMRVNRVLTDDEVKAINEAAGVSDLPRREGYGPGGVIDDIVKMAGRIVSGADEPAKTGIRAYHGSPHDFDRFDMSKIGSGEGNQSYGHGLYFAEHEPVAMGYRDALQFGPVPVKKTYTPDETARGVLNLTGGDIETSLSYLRDGLAQAKSEEQIKRLSDAINILQSSPPKPVGKMYEVNIAADPNTFLDWDKPLSEQPEVLAKLKPLLDDPGVNPEFIPKFTGKDIMSVDGPLAQYIGPKRTPADYRGVLKAEGIPGIKYLDAGSRGAGEGTRNYVVFDDKLISIIRKYGIAGASAMLGYNLMEQLDPKQALAASMADQDYQSSRPKRSMGGNNSVSGALNVARGLHGGM